MCLLYGCQFTEAEVFIAHVLYILVKYGVCVLFMIFFFDIINEIEYNKQNTDKQIKYFFRNILFLNDF